MGSGFRRNDKPVVSFRRTNVTPAKAGAEPMFAFVLALWLIVTACASGPARGNSPATRQPAAIPGQAWPVKTREHVDIWLHAFAILKPDSSKVPYFRPQYFDELTVYKNQRNIFTKLDENRTKLLPRFEINPNLVNSQFLAIYFANWEEMREFLDYFFKAEGDPRRASSAAVQEGISIIAGYFRTAADREWARLFVQSIDDEYNKFYKNYWIAQQQQRAPALAAIDSLWQRIYYPKFKRFLDGSKQNRGDIILSLPLNGEGRLLPGSATSPGGNYSYLAINFPASAGDALQAIYVFAHEVSGRVVEVAVNDHTTPAEGRNGVRAGYESDGLVVGGYFVLKRIAPELADGYARYYLQSARILTGSGSLEAAFLAAFPIPQLIRESIVRQIDAVMSGI